MNECSLGSCNNECFEQEDKCILHCDENLLIDCLEKKINNKDVLVLDEINFPENFRYQVIFDKSKKINFWNCTFNNVDQKINCNSHIKIHFYECEFNKQWPHLDINDIIYSDCDFNDKIIFTKDFSNGVNEINRIVMHNCNIYEEFDLDFSFDNVEECKIQMLDLRDSVFYKKVRIKECKIITSTFINTKFNALCDLYKTEFEDNLFIKTTFGEISVFTESIFHKKVDFKYTTFSKLAIFRKTVFENTLNLEDSIIKEEANFLDITLKKDKQIDIKVENRETARIIKHSFEQQNNIIEANKFYALEMNEREKELKEDIKEGKNIFEWIVFKAHAIASNHSQDWFIALLWIIYFGLIGYTFIDINGYNFPNNFFAVISIPIIILLVIFNKLNKITFSLLLIIFFSFSKIGLNDIVNSVNPFSKIGVDICFEALILKIIIAYLIYQFIVSVRQNTRRK